jgi:formylglycine-generating enzyme required for sulfatase activity
MAGNVRNWIADYYAFDYYTTSPERNPAGPEATLDRVLRGGGFPNDAVEQRSSFRLGGFPSFTDAAVGFRCARDGHPPAPSSP